MQIVTFFLDRDHSARKESTDAHVQEDPANISIEEDDSESINNENNEVPADKEAVASVQSVANSDSEDSDIMECIHGNNATHCTLCNRPTGRYGREFKKKQDDIMRKRQRKKGGIKNVFKRVSFR